MTEELAIHDLKSRLRILGICWLVYGLLRIVTAIWLVFFGATATLMFGALLNRVPDPFAMMSDFHLFYGFLIALSAICGALGFLAGLTLVAGHRAGRTFAVIAAFLSLSSIPLGTTLGIYSLIVLLPLNVRSMSAVAAQNRSASFRGQAATMP